MSDITIKLNRILIYVVCFSFFISVVFRDNIALIALLLGISFAALVINNFKNKNLKILKSMNMQLLFALLVCIFLTYFIFSGAEDIYLLSFTGIFLLTYLIINIPDNNNINNIANAWLIIGLVNSLGIILGLIEINFFNSNFFSKILYDTPYSSYQKHSVSGFLYNYNQAAYFLICSIALIKFQNIFSRKYEISILVLFLISLIITGSRVSLMYVLLLAILFLFFKKNRNLALGLIIALSFFYVFLTNIIIVGGNSYSIGSHHYRELLFSSLGYDFVLGTYGYFKTQAFEVIVINAFVPYGIQNFIDEYGFMPHSMMLGNFLGGGFFFAALILLIISKLLKDIDALYRSGTNFYFISGIILYLAESANWDFSHAMYFWILLMLTPFLIERS